MTPATPRTLVRARVRYAKRDRLRFVSAIDLGRLWERALRRARLPVAYSEGYTPHPRVSFPDALPLGYASEAEYAEVRFTEAVDPCDLRVRLAEGFGPGIVPLDVRVVVDGAPRLSSLLRGSVWDLRYPAAAAPLLGDAVAAVQAASVLEVPRTRKQEVSIVDLRPALHLLSTDAGDGVATPTVRATLHHGEPPMRPSEVHAALARALPDRGALPPFALATRVAQGRPTNEGLEEALAGTFVPPSPYPTDNEATFREQRDQPRGSRDDPPDIRAGAHPPADPTV